MPFFFSPHRSLSRQALSDSNYNIYHKHYYVMGTQFKMAFSYLREVIGFSISLSFSC